MTISKFGSQFAKHWGTVKKFGSQVFQGAKVVHKNLAQHLPAVKNFVEKLHSGYQGVKQFLPESIKKHEAAIEKGFSTVKDSIPHAEKAIGFAGQYLGTKS